MHYDMTPLFGDQRKIPAPISEYCMRGILAHLWKPIAEEVLKDSMLELLSIRMCGIRMEFNLSTSIGIG